MREILFRAKMEDNGQWVLGSFIPDLLEVYQNGPDGWLGDWGFIKPFEEINGSRHMVQVVRETVGQYTGSKDKNGKKIFEGDIISYAGEIFAVEFTDGFAAFIFRSPHNMRQAPRFTTITTKNLEVIGNRWDNPEILEVDQ